MQRILACIILIIALAACGSTPASGTNPSTGPTPRPYLTATPAPTWTIIPTQQTLVLPTSTPVIYSVVKGDTLGSIATHFGITVDALQKANPTVQANALTVGMKLIIPGPDAGSPNAIPTPAALPVSQARCWPDVAGGSWCFALLQNNYAETIENLSVQFTLVDSTGKDLTSQVVYGLLDILPAGKSIPLAAHFPAPTSAGASARVQVLSAIRLLPGDTRYLPAVVENSLARLDASGRTAQVSGKVRLTGAGTAKTIWVLASAFDADGSLVGIRRWESTAELTAGSTDDFSLQISSVGPPIVRVDFLVEARP